MSRLQTHHIKWHLPSLHCCHAPSRMSWALTPLRNGRPLDQHTLVSLETPIGRRELLESTWDACKCGGTCAFCEPTKASATVLSRQMFRIFGDVLQVRGINAHGMVRIDGKTVFRPSPDWSGNLKLKEGMLLTLKYDALPEAVLEYRIVKETVGRETCHSTQEEEETCVTDHRIELSLAAADTNKDESVRVEHDKEDSVVEEPSEEHGNASTPDLSERIQDEPRATADEGEQPESPAIQGTQDLMERIRCRIEADALTWEEKRADMNQVGDGANDGCRVDDTNSRQTNERYGWNGNGNVTRGEIQVVDSVPVELSQLAERPAAVIDATHPSQGIRMIEVVHLVSPAAAIDVPGRQQGKPRSEDAAVDLNSVRNSAESPRFKLFFLHLGQSSKVIQIRASAAKSKGVLVTSNLDDATHLIISGNPSAAAVASFLKFPDASTLATFLMEKHIETCKSEWIIQSDTLKEPTVQQLWNGLAFFQPSMPQQSRKRRRSETSCHPQESRPSSFAMNMKISDCFQILSKLHQDCPLLGKHDFWKAYTLQKISGRLKHLDFEIKDDPQVLQRLRKVDGIGESTLNKIKEYLRTGTLARIEEFQTDELRVAMNTMMHIWGVGAAKASDLLNAGYRTIPQVRNDVKSGKLVLTRNQMIGLECYEDFLEKMERTEVEEIGNIVTKAVHERFPTANVMIMGSYRRGKSTCGDIDLLITHPDYMETTPLGALGELVDRLRQRGHMAYHLTQLTGMREEDSSQSSASQQVPPPEPGPYPHSSSYMGVFYSPTAGKKKRRIDIKFYPYRERVFASLYFTGNGWFNRSMRQWSRRAKKMSLNDHGFFSIEQDGKRLPIEAETERQVFDLLGLVYKEPTERDCFDAVIPIEGGSIEMSRSDLVPSNEKWID